MQVISAAKIRRGSLSEKYPFGNFYPCQSSAEGRLASEKRTFRTAWGGTDNAFIFSVIESYRHNDIYPGKYVNNLLGKLKAFREGTDMTSLLPCYSGL